MKGYGEFNSASDLNPRPAAFERPEPSSLLPNATKDDLSAYGGEEDSVTPPFPIDTEFKLRDPLRAYGEFVGQYPLLTNAQEFIYGIELQRGRHATEKLGADDGTLDPGTIFTLRRQVAYALKARELLRLHNLRLPFSLACQYTYKDEDTLECIQVGNEELLRAIDEFDPYLGRVNNFAYRRVSGAITRHVTREAFAVPPPEKIFQKARAVEALDDPSSDMTKQAFAKMAGIKPESVDQTVMTIRRFLANFGQKCSLDAALEATRSRAITLEDVMRQSTFPEPEANSLWLLAEELLKPQERVVLRLRLEFDMQYKDIGRVIHLSRQAAFDTYRRAIKKLRRAAT